MPYALCQSQEVRIVDRFVTGQTTRLAQDACVASTDYAGGTVPSAGTGKVKCPVNLEVCTDWQSSTAYIVPDISMNQAEMIETAGYGLFAVLLFWGVGYVIGVFTRGIRWIRGTDGR